MLVAWIIYFRATARSLGALGIGLAIALCFSIVWALVYYDFVDLANRALVGWICIGLFALILAAGMSWSHLRRSWAGQVDVDDVDEQ
jgi:hypothetical protein